MMKFQITNFPPPINLRRIRRNNCIMEADKSQINSNDQNSNVLNVNPFGHSEIGIWSLFGIWCLVLGIFTME
jgi:hypothetical protein